MVKVAKSVGSMFQLLQGYSAETSGGLLLAINKESAPAFIKDIKEMEDCDAWIIGDVTEGPRTANIVDDPTIIEVWNMIFFSCKTYNWIFTSDVIWKDVC